MTNPFVTRLMSLAPLSEVERHAAEDLTAHVRRLRARENISTGDGEPRALNAVMSGWACRYTILPDGRRQITALHLPGELCDLCGVVFGGILASVSAITPATVAGMPIQVVRDAMVADGQLREALWRSASVATEVQREWVVNLGRRTAIERLAHLFCDVSARLAVVGLSDGSRCEMPLTQADLADVAGLSAVHVNRSLQELRSSGLIDLRARHLVIHDRRALMDLAMFDGAYLGAQAP